MLHSKVAFGCTAAIKENIIVLAGGCSSGYEYLKKSEFYAID
jgi:hypothetical protein